MRSSSRPIVAPLWLVLITLAVIGLAATPALAQDMDEAGGDTTDAATNGDDATTDETDDTGDDAATNGDGTNGELEAENERLKNRVQELEAEIAELTAEPEEEPPPQWFGEIRLILSAQIGTSDIFSLTTKGFITHTDYEVYEMTLSAFQTWQITEGNTTAAEAFGRYDFKYIDLDYLFPFAHVEMGFNDTRLIDFYADLGAGVEWVFLRDPYPMPEYGKNPNYMASLLGGVSWRFESYHPSANTPDDDFVRLLLGAYGEWFLNDQVTITDRLTYQPAFEDFGDFILTNALTINVLIEDNLGIAVAYRLTYDSEPPANVEDVEHFITVEFWWVFEA